MPDNIPNQPHLDPRLPDELAQCESLLGRMSLPPSQVQRDELMYRAGWAAAEVHADSVPLQGTAQREVAGYVGISSTVKWSLVSAAIAASLAVVITLRVQPAINSPSTAVTDVARPGDSTTVRVAQTPSESLVNLTPEGFNSVSRIDWTAPLLIMRDRALLGQWDDGRLASEDALVESDDGITSRPRTSREMLQEFLPGPSLEDASAPKSLRRRFQWPWQTTRIGETT